MQENADDIHELFALDPDVETVLGFTGGARAAGGFMLINLKPVS